jgi:hypothetical protein
MSFDRRCFNADRVFFLLVLFLYLAGQLLIGTCLPDDGAFHFDAPADVDFLYYAGIIQQMKHNFPPQNPACGGTPLSQSFIQYYPTVLASYVLNPYLSMRVMNLAYLLLFAWFLRRYFLTGWGISLSVIAAGSIGFGLINSPGIDLIARGFNHFPFFIALTVALFERKSKWPRYAALFLLGWFHSYSTLLVFIYFVSVMVLEKFRRSSVADAGITLAGLLSAGLLTAGVADKPFYFPLIEGFRFDLTDLWMHALITLIPVAAARNARLYIMFAVAFIFGLLFHYNPFFPVFILYFAAGPAAAELVKSLRHGEIITAALAGLLFIGFIVGAIGKYDPDNGNYYPHLDPIYKAAGRWLEENTASDAVLLAVPLDSEWSCRLMEKRALYLGFIPHVAHLGIDWRERGRNIANYFASPFANSAEIDYIIYGPVEERLFPAFILTDRPVYKDELVTIWKARN